MMMIEDADVRMKSELIEVTCLANYAVYGCDFEFVNDGEPRTVRMGFPFPVEYIEGDYLPPGAVRVWQDGRPLELSTGEGMDGDVAVRFFVHDVEMPQGSTIVTVQYLGLRGSGFVPAPPESPEAQSNKAAVYGIRTYPYQVHTGAGWSGPIEETVIRYTLTEERPGEDVDYAMKQLWHSSTRVLAAQNMLSYKNPSPRMYAWVYRDYEPTRDHNVELAYLSSPEAEETVSGHVSPGGGWESGAELNGLLELAYSGSLEVSEIRILPGKTSTPEEFARYARPKTLKVEFDSGHVATLRLRDELAMQVFPVSITASKARMTVLDTYPGTPEGAPAYLSGLEFARLSSPQGIWEPFDVAVPPGSVSVQSDAGTTVTDSADSGSDASTSVPVSAVADAPEAPGGSWVPMFVLAGIAIVGFAGVGSVMSFRRGRADTNEVVVPLGLVLRGPEGSHMIREGVTTIGIGERSDIVIAGDGVAAMHAGVEIGPEGTRLRVVSWSHRTLLNGQPISDASLSIGDRIVLGDALLVVEADGEA